MCIHSRVCNSVPWLLPVLDWHKAYDAQDEAIFDWMVKLMSDGYAPQIAFEDAGGQWDIPLYLDIGV